MDSPLFLQREAKLFVAFDDTSVFEIPLLEGFSFSQGTNVTEVALSEASSDGVTSRRGTARFTDSLAPAEFSFSTYVRPFKSTGNATPTTNAFRSGNSYHTSVETCLWALFAGAKSYTATSSTVNAAFVSASAGEAVTTFDGTDADITFEHSNKLQLHTPDFYLSLGVDKGTATGATVEALYKLSGAVLNEATINFDIDGIATIDWAGFATLIEDVSANPESKGFISGTTSEVTPTVAEGISATNNFIQNRLSTVTLTNATDPNSNYLDEYTLTLTGGSINFSNNIEYVTPSTMGVVNQPLGHYTGARAVSGTLHCYLDGGTGRSKDLFEDLAESSTFDAVTFFGLTINLGGTTASTPRLAISVPAAHLEIPVHAVDEVIGMEVNFHGLPSSGSAAALVQTISAANEASLKYIGITPDNNAGD